MGYLSGAGLEGLIFTTNLLTRPLKRFVREKTTISFSLVLFCPQLPAASPLCSFERGLLKFAGSIVGVEVPILQPKVRQVRVQPTVKRKEGVAPAGQIAHPRLGAIG